MSVPLAVDVIVPVYGNLPVVRRCLESVLANRTSIGRVIVVDDASPDSSTVLYLDDLRAKGHIEVIRQPVNQGVVVAENAGMAASGRDVIVLNSDTEVHGDWARRMLACAYAAADIGTVTPFSNEGSICSYPYLAWWSGMPGTLGLGVLDALFSQENAGEFADLPTGTSFCMLIRRACLDVVGELDVPRYGRGYGEETDLCQRAWLAGWRSVICADTFVFHEAGGSFGPERQERAAAADRIIEELYPGYGSRVRDFVMADGLRAFRERVDAARAGISPDEARTVLDERAAEKTWLLDMLRREVGYAAPDRIVEHA